MKIKKSFLTFLIVLMLPALTWAKIFKWTDENGKVHFGNQIPVRYQKNSSDVYNKRGLIIERKQAARDPKEIQREEENKRRIEKLRKEQLAILKKQQAKDRKLLKKYQNEDEIILYRDGKIKALDVKIDITKSYINRLKRQVSDSQKAMAGRERQGLTISNKLQTRLDNQQQQIEDFYAQIVKRKEDKQIIFGQGAKELKHFRKLQRISKNRTTSVEISSNNNQKSLELNDIVTCSQAKLCERYWKRAIVYLKKHTNVSISVMGDRIIMTERPLNKNDISLTLTRSFNPTSNMMKIFLDAQCSLTVEGTELCKSKKVQNITGSFKKIIMAKKR